MIAHKDPKQTMKNLQTEFFADYLRNSEDAKSFLYTDNGKIRTMLKQISSKYDFIVVTTILQEDLEKPALISIRDITIIALVTLISTGFFLYHLLNLKLKPLEDSSFILKEMAEGNLTG